MPRVPRGPRRPPRHTWHRLARASVAGPAAAGLPAIMAAPALAMGAAEESSGSSFDALSAKMNVLVHVPLISSHKVVCCVPKMVDSNHQYCMAAGTARRLWARAVAALVVLDLHGRSHGDAVAAAVKRSGTASLPQPLL